jgi:hypothetical protein
MKSIALVFVALFFTAPARSEDALDRVCSNEVSLFCPGMGTQAKRRCLLAHRDAALPFCREMLRQDVVAEDASPSRASEAPGAEREARLVGTRGAVYLHKAGSPEGEFVVVSAGVPLLAGDWLRVGLDGSAELMFDGATSVALSSGTDLALTSLARAGTELRLALGALTAKVSKLGSGERFRVRTPTAVAAVRGTEFVVEQDEDDGDSRVAVVDEGEVAVTAASGGEPVLVRPRQETSVRRDAVAPEAPRALAQMRARAEAYVDFRARAAQSARTWAPTTPAARSEMRARMSAQPTISASRLTGVRPQQRTMTHPAVFKGTGTQSGRPTQPGGRTAQPGGRTAQSGAQTAQPGSRSPNTPASGGAHAPVTPPRSATTAPSAPSAPPIQNKNAQPAPAAPKRAPGGKP